MIYDHTLFVLLEKFEDIKGVIRSCCIHILYVKYINKIKLVFSWVRVVQSLDFCVVFCRSLFVLLYFFLFAIVLSVLLRYTNSDYPFGIFKLFFLWWLFIANLNAANYKRHQCVQETVYSPDSS